MNTIPAPGAMRRDSASINEAKESLLGGGDVYTNAQREQDLHDMTRGDGDDRGGGDGRHAAVTCGKSESRWGGLRTRQRTRHQRQRGWPQPGARAARAPRL